MADRTVRKVTDLKEQRLESYRYWQSRTAAERMDAIEEVVRDIYLARGIDLDTRPVDKTVVRIERPEWKAA
jgi:hypothetical protein